MTESRNAIRNCSGAIRLISKRRISKKQRSRRRFRKFLLIYVCVLAAVCIGICLWLRGYLADYEKVQPVYLVSDLVRLYEDPEALASYIEEHGEQLHCLEDPVDFASYYCSYVTGKEISFVEDAIESRTERPVYHILADGENAGTVTLAQSGKKSAAGFATYEIRDLDLRSMLPGSTTLDILVPEGASVSLRDQVLDESYIIADGIPDILERSLPFLEDKPVYTTYEITAFLKEGAVDADTEHGADPYADLLDIQAVDADGSRLEFAQSRNLLVAGALVDKAFLEDVQRVVEKGVEVWALYFVYLDQHLPLYVMEGTDLYAYLFGSDEVNRIDPSLYNYEYIDSYSFSVLQADNYVRYAPDCFTVDVQYKLDLVFTDPALSDDNQKLDATWVWVPDGSGSWSISDIVYH